MKNMRQLINLMEGVMAVPGVGVQPGAGSESEMQNNSTATRNNAYAAFNAAQQPATESAGGDYSEYEQELRAIQAQARELRSQGDHDGARTSYAHAYDALLKRFPEQHRAYVADQNAGAWKDNDWKNSGNRSAIDEEPESPAQVVSCNQSNPANASKACAMEEQDIDSDELLENNMEYSPEVQQALADFENVVMNLGMPPEDAHDRIVQRLSPDAVEEFKAALQSMGQSEVDTMDDSIPADHDKVVHAPEPAMNDFSDDEENQFEEAFDFNNGYGDINDADGNDYFPSGADSPVVSDTGPSGARQGDNPEQKKMQVDEVHKELVYEYRSYLKEAETINELSKDTLKSYSKKRSKDVHDDQRDAKTSREHAKFARGMHDEKSAAGWEDDANWLDNRAEKGAGNVAKAVVKTAKK